MGTEKIFRWVALRAQIRRVTEEPGR